MSNYGDLPACADASNAKRVPGPVVPILYSREALEGRRRVLGDDHPDTLSSINFHCSSVKSLGYGFRATTRSS